MDDTLLDLAAYARRIGHPGAFAPTLDGLRQIVTHHARTIAFENIDPVAGRVPRLDVASLQGKLVFGGRGGYCFEQNGLLMAVLRQCGFDVRPREARVRAGVAPDVQTGRTHMALEVRLDDVAWLVDVGFGRPPLAPLRLASHAEQDDGTGTYRFVASEDALMLQGRSVEGWSDSYLLLPSAPTQIDREIGNWYVATHPNANMRHKLLVARAVQGGGRMILYNRELSVYSRDDEPPRVSEIDGHVALRDVLADGFGLQVTDAEVDTIVAVLERLPSAKG